MIIVGTHCDVVQKTHPAGWVEQLGLLVERRYMPSAEPDKFGLPRVVAHVEVSCRGRIIGRSLRVLADRIFTVAVEEHLPGSLPVCITCHDVAIIVMMLVMFRMITTKITILRPLYGSTCCLQCFDAVGWVAGRASSVVVLAWLSIWSNLHMVQLMPLPPHHLLLQ